MMWAEASPIDYLSYGALKAGEATGPDTISAIFEDRSSAEAAIIEMRQLGIRSDDISLISRDWPEPVAGLPQESLYDGGLTFRAAPELPNDEDLPTTEADLTGEPIPPGSGDDLVRRSDASSDAELDIYTDYPDDPGGINPASPAAPRAPEASTEQAAVDMRAERARGAAVGAGMGSLAGLLVGVTSLAVPGLGPIVAAGPLATALGDMLAGGATGGIIGALSTSGVPQEYARRYAASLQEGQTLITVRTAPLALDAIERILIANGGNEVHC